VSYGRWHDGSKNNTELIEDILLTLKTDEVPWVTTGQSRLSACIITYNEADRIEDCLRSVSFCDELVVVDSHSTDSTRDIASSLGARVIERDWPGYRTQKQFAVDTASSDWVLCLDADERVTAKLRSEIEALRARDFTGCAGWSVPRITEYFGRFLRHGNAYPDRLIRLFDRRHGRWIGDEIHENTRVNGPVGRLRGHLEHFSYRSLTDHQRRMGRYADLMAHALYARGKRCGLLKVLVNPQWRFFRGYFVRLGFLDGWRGLVFALVEANYVRRKYLALYMLSKGLAP
jgi:glycosyltransferase involved in cell wall biosynthesis